MEETHVMQQIASHSKPNSKHNTFLLCAVNCKDSQHNLKIVLSPYKEQISRLQSMKWRGKTLRVFLFGDYDFLLKLYGLSAAQSIHPCLWCTTTENQLQKAPHKQPRIPPRTLQNIKRNYYRFSRAGHIKKNAKGYNNAVHQPIWYISLTHVAPPYLHLLLGIVKRHHSLPETEYHQIDILTAHTLASNDQVAENQTAQTATFTQYIKKLRAIKVTQEEKRMTD